MKDYNESSPTEFLYSEPAEPFKPIPFVLPDPLSAFVEAGSKSIGCDPAFIVLPLLSVLGSAIGNTRRLVAKPGWHVPSIIWTAIIGESGTQKSVAQRLIVDPIRQRQKKLFQDQAAELERYELEIMHYKRDFNQWQKSKNKNDPPEHPAQPIVQRLLVSDTTIEALAPILLANPRGLLVENDELSGWFGSFDRYNTSSGDRARWLSMYNGGSFTIDRKTGFPRTIHVPSAAVAITGGIQPGILARTLNQDHRESGLAARLLFACPPRKSRKWTDSIPADDHHYESLLDHLFGLGFGENEKPVLIGMDQAAKRLYKSFYNDHADELAELAGDLAAAYSKLEEHPLRLALILHCCQRRDGAVQADTMESAITLVQWFKYETTRVYKLLSENPQDRQMRELTEWIRNRGGIVTAREVQQGRRSIKTAEHAELALQNLIDVGYGDWIPSEPGKRGQPTRRFQLRDPVYVYGNTPSPSRNGNTVDVDTVDNQKPQTKRIVI